MIKYNQGEIYLIMWDFNKGSSNEINSGAGNKAIPSGGNIVVGIDVHYEIPLFFGLATYGEAQVFFRVSEVNGTSYFVVGAFDIGNPEPMLITVFILLEGY